MAHDLAVSVVVPVLNGGATIGDLLTALTHQAGPPRHSTVIVVDNGSTDSTPHVVSRFPVTYLQEPVPGPSAARNRGLSHARGEVVVFVDADTMPTRHWLAEMTAPFADGANVVVGGHAVAYRPTTPAQRFMAQLGARRLEHDFFRSRVPYVAGESIGARRDALIAVGGWDEGLRTAEDLDVCVRLARRHGCGIVRQPRAVLFTRRRASFEALLTQAWDYGQGLAQVHLRYPDVIPLSGSRWLMLGSTLALRRAKACALAAGQRLGVAGAERADFARHHWNWSKSFWGGFLSMLRHRAWRPR
jgi:cellulose synthase/poly-beta-1,6-N-acetylglucosamine synthase-like glycosyltransferase